MNVQSEVTYKQIFKQFSNHGRPYEANSNRSPLQQRRRTK